MNQILKFATILFFSSALISCGDGTHNHNATESHDHSEHHADHADHDHDHDLDNNLAIELNKGDRWLVNDEMKPHVEKGEQALKAYTSSNGSDYKALAQELKSADKALISSCTMEGKSHDELHKWLHPHLTLVSDLESAETEQEANDVIAKLQESYQNYHTYFQ